MASKTVDSGASTDVFEAFIDLVIFVVTVGCLITLRFLSAPAIGPATFLVPGQEPLTKDLPAFFDSMNENIVALVTIDLRNLHPNVFAVQVDDCIERLAVNGVPVIPDHVERVCSPHDLTRLNLTSFLKPGRNTLSIAMSDIGVTQGLNIRASNTDSLLLAIWLGIISAIVWYARRLRSLLPPEKRWPTIIMSLVLFGTLVRVMYAGATPYNMRAHDMEGHIDYINHMQEHWNIPVAMNGWEFHQPPFYYAVAALWSTILEPFHVPNIFLYQSLGAWSLVLAILTYTVSILTLSMLLQDRRHVARAGAILAVFSGFVFFATRITNETLSAFLTVSTIALLLVWWKRGDRTTLVALSLVFALGFLTKISILALAPAMAAALLFRPGVTFKRRLTDIVIGSMVVLLAAGWYPAHRLFFEPEQEKTLTLGNDGMDLSLAVSRDIPHMLTFNPVAVVQHPFNDPWDNEYRREYFPEYFFRSAFFGEYRFESFRVLSQSLLILAMLLLPAMVIGLLVDLRRRFMALLPFHIATFGMCIGAFLYPYFFAFAPNQDFRFSVILIVPAAYYCVRGIETMPVWLRAVWRGFLLAFVVTAFIFIGALFVHA